MADDDIVYMYRTEKTIRGNERRTIEKWEADGWELDKQETGLARTTLTFRKARPKTQLPALLTNGWTSFRAMPAKTQRNIAAAAAAVVVLIIVGISVAVAASGGDDSQGPAAIEPTDTPTREPSTEGASEQPSDEPSEEPSPTEPAEPEIITTKNNDEFAALLKTSDSCSKEAAAFATDYAGRTIDFDANVAALANHGSYDTRYDILIIAGDYSETHAEGPSFQFRDVNIIDINLHGADSITTGDNLHVTAEVGKYEKNTCLFQLDPVKTVMRK